MIPQRQSVKVLLFDRENRLLLMHIDDPKTRSTTGQYHGSFWAPIGGGVKSKETDRKAAIREVYEETGIVLNENELGPLVWFGEFDLILDGKLTHIKQSYFVAVTHQTQICLSNLTRAEKKVVRKLAWFSLKELQESTDLFFPIVLKDYILDIFAKRYPENPLQLDLSLQPK